MVRKVDGFAWLVLAGVVLSNPFQAQAQDKPKGPTHKVQKSNLSVVVPLKGVFEAEEMSEVALAPKAWTPALGGAPLIVQKAVEHGAKVKKGDVLVQLDLERIDQAIKDLREERTVTEANIRQTEEELAILEKSTPVELAAAERARKVADEDLEKFLKVNRPLDEESARRSVENSEFFLLSSEAELKQLQKMYRDKDLTEETEEFILKRQKHQVRMAEFNLKSSRIHGDQTLNIDLPRREVNLREAATKQEIAWEKAREGLPLALNQKRLALKKMQYDFAKSTKRLENLEKDREAMTVKAPADGIVYYGKPVRGQWSGSATMSSKLTRGGMLSPEEVFITIVNTRPLFVRAVVEEKDLHLLQPGEKARIVVTGYPDLKLTGEVKEISAIPQSPGNFEARVAVDSLDAIAVTPGMACTAKVAAYRKEGALTVPDASVFTDNDDDSRYVYLTKGANSEKRTVKVGKTSGGKTEIVDGLQEGDEILASKPQE